MFDNSIFSQNLKREIFVCNFNFELYGETENFLMEIAQMMKTENISKWELVKTEVFALQFVDIFWISKHLDIFEITISKYLSHSKGEYPWELKKWDEKKIGHPTLLLDFFGNFGPFSAISGGLNLEQKLKHFRLWFQFLKFWAEFN